MLSPVEVGLEVLELLRQRRFGAILEMFPPPLRQLVSAEVLEAAWSGELEKIGGVVSIGPGTSEPAGAGGWLVRVPIGCQRGAIALMVSVQGDGSVTGLQIAPAEAAAPVAPWEPPAYADPGRFDEVEVSVGTGELAVPGTLSLPRDRTAVAAVVLLAGSGPADRDETMGRNKPFRDLAFGLASREVAVLRFDKVTFAHPAAVRAVSGFTVADEYLPAASAAIQLLLGRVEVDRNRVFLLGHSLGGTVAPRVAAAEPQVAGLVILAGGAEPLHWSIVRQLRHLAALNPATESASQAAIERLTKQAELVDSPDLGTSTAAATLPLGVPPAYWLDLRRYDPVATARALRRPVLLLQGGRDYQATVVDDLARWRSGLDGVEGVTVRVIPADDHFFFPGTGPSTPAEYEAAQHLDQEVVEEVAGWVGRQGGRTAGRG